MKTIQAEASQVPFAKQIEEIVMSTPITDIHTHLYEPVFAELLLWGIDELLTYHYLVAETFRYLDMPYEKYWAMSKTQQADLIWDTLFIQHSPISEACRGVLTTLQLLGLDVKKRDLPALRKYFKGQNVDGYITKCMELAGLKKIYMTNSPFDDLERPIWEKGFKRDSRFQACLRIDPLFLWQAEAAPKMAKMGYKVDAGAKPNQKFFDEIRRFLADWAKKMNPRYVMASIPPEYTFPDKTMSAQILEKAILPFCRESGLPLALMPGVRKLINPGLRLAGDGVGLSNLLTIQHLCAQFPENKFLLTVLARENQHEACVLARKYRNLHLFGCWWFTNIPEIINEMTRMRLELIGLSITPQHSDARVLDQIIYKWNHSRRIIAEVLVDKYADIAKTGWHVSREEVQRDVKDLFGGAFERFCG
jgi:hypothetical protein